MRVWQLSTVASLLVAAVLALALVNALHETPDTVGLPDYTMVARDPWGVESERSGNLTLIIRGRERTFAMSWACWTATQPGQVLPSRVESGTARDQPIYEDCR